MIKHNIRLLISLVLITITLKTWAQSDVITGNAKTYAGDTLKMYAINDCITHDATLIATAKVDQDGNFRFNVKTKEIIPAYIDLTVFRCMLYLQPNTDQKIVLPEKQEISEQDKLNPFFQPYRFYAKLIDPKPEDLNVIIPQFDQKYNQALNGILMSPYGTSKAVTDSIESLILTKFNSKNNYFKDYMKYRFAMLDYTAYHRNKEILMKEYFSGKDVLIKNPAYTDLFDELFSNPFANFKNMFVNYKDKYIAIHDRSYHSLKQSLKSEQKIGTENLADFLILKGLKDAYYSDSFPKETLVAIADSMITASKNSEYRKIASSLSKKFTKLLCGYPAPQFILTDTEGKTYNVNSFNGKFTYLVFFNPKSYTAQSELELLSGIRKDFPAQILEIVVIFVSNKKSDYDNFCKQSEIKDFPILWYNSDTEMLNQYNVRAFPTYYLISPEGNLSMNPAPSPSEYFQPKFDALYRNWKNEQYRNQYRNNNNNQGIK